MINKKRRLMQILSISVIILLSVLSLTFFYLYINCCGGFLFKNKITILTVLTIVITLLTAIAILFQIKDNYFVFRLCFLILLIWTVVIFLLYILKTSGFWEKVNSVEDIRSFITQTGGSAVVIFIIMQILQVVVLPIPGIIMIGAGIALFGRWLGGIYSFIGILIGSIIGFFIGRILGYKAVKWLVGGSLDKTIESVKGKDRIVLSFMFLLPFFPDDILCFVSGISSMSIAYFMVMIILTRFISVLLTTLSLSGLLIPYNNWWGILLWGVVIVVVSYLTYLIYKYGDNIENYCINKLNSLKERKKKK